MASYWAAPAATTSPVKEGKALHHIEVKVQLVVVRALNVLWRVRVLHEVVIVGYLLVWVGDGEQYLSGDLAWVGGPCPHECLSM